ncbi:MAG: YraN family protein [Candidatus Moranbacteria bacterium CG23_combo_of_CG06-09_8_20_14_all_35_22]|nr:MAG: YraN family protein [Candidatus Moranbacteria bacterium CG23_combo_of_CG06-09_8_20_14_all_35_22]
MINTSKNLGNLGEETAVKFLQNNGYKILDRNFQNNFGRRLGEIDIIAKDTKENEIVFVEVKTREYEKYKDTDPEENITYVKLKKLAKIASAYLRIKNLENEPFRFDALSVWISEKTGESKIKHIPNL